MDEKMKKHGRISWSELMTSDVEASKRFYGKIFGWEFQDVPAGDITYTIVKSGDEEIAGIMGTPPEAEGCPPCWGTYVTVDDVDETARLVAEQGGKVEIPPRDIPDVGRFTVFQDPSGAYITAITYI